MKDLNIPEDVNEQMRDSRALYATHFLADFYCRDDLEAADIDGNDEAFIKNLIRRDVIRIYDRYSTDPRLVKDDLKLKVIEGLRYVIACDEQVAIKIWQHEYGSFMAPDDDARRLFQWVLDIVYEHDPQAKEL